MVSEAGDLNWRVEEACLNAWPSPRQVVAGDWVIRIAGGDTRRTNSVNPLRAAAHDPRQVLEAAQAVFRAQGQPTLFRIPDMVQGDAVLEELGFSYEGGTTTLFADLSAAEPSWDEAVELTNRPTNEWLKAKAKMSAQSEQEQWVYEAMLGSIVAPKAFAASRVDGEIGSVAYGVVHEGLLIVESVVTDSALRQRGLARRTVGKLLAWACGQAAQGAALQVVSDNTPAIGLYRTLGFGRELYRYHYRREPEPWLAGRHERRALKASSGQRG